jgi:hypothetical protein
MAALNPEQRARQQIDAQVIMSNPAPQLVQKLWNYCNILRDDGPFYGDCVEQLTFLLFLKMPARL